MNAAAGQIVGIDVGGTFTDLIFYDDKLRRFATAKVPSNRGDEAVGFLAGLTSFGPLSELSSIVHGTTVGTNALLERRGARVWRCPLIDIVDARDPAPVLAWMRRLIAGGCDDLILLTGEGLRRLLRCAAQHEPDLRQPFIAALANCRIVTRGPKPARALKELGLSATLAAEASRSLRARIADYDDPQKAYHARIAVMCAKRREDYDHLSRVKEWGMERDNEEDALP